eukprot:TRINITY_DN850_c0_g1_i1.p1 TRINITY_DN850_c0_g1~~TRINITY_DN850_c0_g1_i1.p1  ORF type:complete len:392 (-),score=153.20 TRINITY_DN850_c0_g1_i1:547-1722(-)
MGKRTAAVQGGKAKAARLEHAGEEVDHSIEQCAPVLELLGQADELSDSCREMWAAISPHMLRTAKDARHEYQTKLVDMLSTVVSGIEAERSAAVAAAETELQDLATEKVSAIAAVDTTAAAADAARQDRDAKEASMKEAEQAVSAADEVLKAAQHSVANLETERKEHASEKTEYETVLAETWEQLKSSSISGQKWRERAKLIQGVLEMLEKVGLDKSLKAGLPGALKIKPAERGRFAQRAVTYAEELLKKHIADVETKLGGMDAEGEARAKAVTDAEAVLKDAQESKSKSDEAFIQAENILLEKDADATNARKEEQAFEPKSKQLNIKLASAKTSLEEFGTTKAKYHELVEGPAQPAAEEAEATDEAVATEEVAAVPMEQIAEEAPVEVAA